MRFGAEYLVAIVPTAAGRDRVRSRRCRRRTPAARAGPIDILDDRGHVGGAGAIVTQNLSDFPNTKVPAHIKVAPTRQTLRGLSAAQHRRRSLVTDGCRRHSHGAVVVMKSSRLAVTVAAASSCG